MATLIVTKDKGGAGRPQGMTVVLPSQQVPLKDLKAIGKAAGFDGVVLADIVSALAMHERAAARFAHAAAAQTEMPERQEVFEALAQVHTERVDALESLLFKLDLPRLYASPTSRVTSRLAEGLIEATLLAGSIAAETREFVLLDVAFTLAERSLADGQTLTEIAEAALKSGTKVALSKAVKALNAEVAQLEEIRALRGQCLLAAVTAKIP